MGAVYMAEHPFMGRKAAIKVLRREFAEDRGLVERFMNEARAANAIRHANIIEILDVGRLPSGIPYLMMEYLDGVNLSRRIAQLGRLAPREAVEIAIQTTAALAAAHTRGIVHRDLKPDNLFLIADDTRAGGERVKVLDFGIAKLRGDLATGMVKTQIGSLMGTPPYMSPEQCRGVSDEVDHRTDVYALGIILYEMLCGAPPFVMAGWGEVVLAHMTQAPVPPRVKNPEIPPAVEAVILKALSKAREARFQSMAEMQAALRFTDSLITAGRATGAEPVAAAAHPPSPTTAPIHRPTTTFRGAAGEITPSSGILPTRRELGLVGPKRESKVGLVVAGATIALAAIIAVTIASGKKRPERSPSATTTAALSPERPSTQGRPAAPVVAAAPAATAPAAPEPAIPRLSVETAPAEGPAPAAAPASLRLKIVSDPAGALITDAHEGTILGSTPFERRIDRAAQPLELRVVKSGFATAALSVPREKDFETTIHLDRLKHVVKREPAARARAAAAGDVGPAAAPSPIRPVASPPSPPKPPAVEKW